MITPEPKNFSQEVISGFVTYSVWNNLGKVLALINSLLIIYVFSVYDYGTYKLVFAFLGILQMFQLSGFDGVISNDVLRSVGEKNEPRAGRIFFEFAILKLFFSALIFLGFRVIISVNLLG